ncbi:MAG: helix-turn-helix transcriptional regulator [Rikenellaceae bacterium]
MENTSILITFGKRIQLLRKERGLSQEQLAEEAGLHRTYIGMIERGEKNITLKNIEKLAKGLKLNAEFNLQMQLNSY